ncbi:nucleoside monophosphate kinase [Candidatus Pacearchaeota archaeon]|nr:nucleoside monophosphate kinase [Candidatus Pacearchaeota archaeon]
MRLLFFGAQGSGKGTQAKIISKKIGILHLSTGDIFRNAEGELRKEIDSYILAGNLVPDELTLKMLEKRIYQDDCKEGFILDGYPRNINQARTLDEIMGIDYVVEIAISDNVAFERILNRISCKTCGAIYNIRTLPPKEKDVCDKCNKPLSRRADDNEEALRVRLSIYHREIEPVLKNYKTIKVSGEQPIEAVTKDILINIGYR